MGGEPARGPEVSSVQHLLNESQTGGDFLNCFFLCLQSSLHLRACARRGSPQYHAVAEVCGDGDEEPAGESLSQHLGPSHHHPAPCESVLVRFLLMILGFSLYQNTNFDTLAKTVGIVFFELFENKYITLNDFIINGDNNCKLKMHLNSMSPSNVYK